MPPANINFRKSIGGAINSNNGTGFIIAARDSVSKDAAALLLRPASGKQNLIQGNSTKDNHSR